MRSNFFKLSSAVVLTALLVIGGLSATSVSAGVQPQATMAATMMSGTMMSGTMMAGATMASGMDGAYPPCPVAMGAMSGTMASTMMMPATMMSGMMASTMMPATMMAGATMAMTMPAAAMVTSPFVDNKGCKLTATLAGTNEVPKVGAPNGKGTAILTITRPATGPGQICFQLTVSGITLPASAAHIHAGAAGVAGPVVVPFAAPDATGKSSGCTSGVSPALIEQILTEPATFYVNVHNADFPAGAMRGQLSASAS